MTDEPRHLGHDSEPQNSGAVVAVHWGDYRRQEIWVRSGSNIGNWYPLGGEYGRPKGWDDPRGSMEKLIEPNPPPRPAGTVPQHPDWSDVLARGPVTLLVPADDSSYRAGWRAGRHSMFEAVSEHMESLTYDEPEGTGVGNPFAGDTAR